MISGLLEALQCEGEQPKPRLPTCTYVHACRFEWMLRCHACICRAFCITQQNLCMHRLARRAAFNPFQPVVVGPGKKGCVSKY